MLSLVLAPEGVELAVVDRNGVTVAHTPTKDNPVGTLAPEADRIKQVASFRGRGTDLGPDAEGVERIYAFYPAGGKTPRTETYVTASVPTAIAFAEADRLSRNNLLGLADGRAGGPVCWRGTAAKRSCCGRRPSNSKSASGNGPGNSSTSNSCCGRFLDNVPDSVYFKEYEGTVPALSRAQAQRFGLKDPALAIGKTDFDFFAKDHAQEAFEDEQRIIQTGQPVIGVEENSPLADGAERWVSTSKMPLARQGRRHRRHVGYFARDHRAQTGRDLAGQRAQPVADARGSFAQPRVHQGYPAGTFIGNALHRAFSGSPDRGRGARQDRVRFLSPRPRHPDPCRRHGRAELRTRRAPSRGDADRRQRQQIRASTSKIPFRDEQRRIAGLVCIYEILGEQK